MRIPTLASIAPLAFLAACGNPLHVEGGPCAYETSEITAKVITVQAEEVEFTDGEWPFYIPLEQFGGVPAVGDEFRFNRQLITKGTCTPSLYTLLPDDTGN